MEESGAGFVMRTQAESWLPLSPGERSVAIEVLVHGPLSRTEIARRLDLSPGSLTRLTKPLIQEGLLVEVEEAGATEGRQGRPSQPLDVVADSRHFLGFKITDDTVYGVLTTLRSEIVARLDRSLAARDPGEVADVLAGMTRELSRGRPRPAGLGIGVGGLVEGRSVVGESPFLGWRGVPLAALVEERTGLPVVVENDTAAFVEAETWFGAGRGLDRFVVLTIGAGLGYGLVLGGRRVPYSGDEDRGFGRHWILDPYGPLTPDGRRGSAVSLLTIPNIRYQVRAATGRDVGYEEILASAAAGEPMPARVVGEAARALGILVAQIANFVMPQKILLAGEGVGLMKVAGDVVENTIRDNRHPRAAPVVLETRVSDFHDWARGAAVLAIQVLVLGAAQV
ncbi:ROK family transcriptional regulator [Streptomyces sp. WAC04189]|nr:ROK family transcriptional regulator [Streptomyces sp. SS52]QCR50975.1 ROK family transcriptional regulator [Streptomyces sp. SGAir0924]RSS04848.1 ROK family transcriptional regulator [Streptomyces sp. WAC04189]RSS18338.1 ROK family transcriptional regulator [Streptomyces sp. WAC05458]RSS19264.1 ROK family transcriptional regulator [Streptomyces sp. WAC08401]RSS27333.1 ROK family transcriptional regulator [Streptomyces sp. WAC08452]RSS92056.1 ROK family transcriptional regulator [Streptomy